MGKKRIELLNWPIALSTRSVSGTSSGSSSSMSDNETFDSYYNDIYEMLGDFHDVYKEAHPYLSICICLCGILFNVCNVVVLTRPGMDRNPINALLTVIAVCDGAVMLSYVPFAVWTSRDRSYCAVHGQTFAWALFILFHSAWTVICHAVSIWLTVATAFVRAVTVRQVGCATKWTARKGYTLSLGILSTVVMLHVPGILSYTWNSGPFDGTRCKLICPDYGPDDDGAGEHYDDDECVGVLNDTKYDGVLVYNTTVSKLGRVHGGFVLKMALLINGVLFKLVPCILLTVFIAVLLVILTEVKKRKVRLYGITACGVGIGGGGGGTTADGGGSREILSTTGIGGTRSSPIPSPTSERAYSSFRRADRTTLMLIVLLTVFLLAELPHGVLAIVTSFSSTDFRQNVYMNLGILMDLLSLANSAANFVIYFAMSQKFREVFLRTFLPSATCRQCRTRIIRSSRHPRIYEPGDPSLYATGDAMALQRRPTSTRSRSKSDIKSGSSMKRKRSTLPEIRLNGLDVFTSSSPGMIRKQPASESMSPLLQSPPASSYTTE